MKVIPKMHKEELVKANYGCSKTSKTRAWSSNVSNWTSRPRFLMILSGQKILHFPLLRACDPFFSGPRLPSFY